MAARIPVARIPVTSRVLSSRPGRSCVAWNNTMRGVMYAGRFEGARAPPPCDCPVEKVCHPFRFDVVDILVIRHVGRDQAVDARKEAMFRVEDVVARLHGGVMTIEDWYPYFDNLGFNPYTDMAPWIYMARHLIDERGLDLSHPAMRYFLHEFIRYNFRFLTDSKNLLHGLWDPSADLQDENGETPLLLYMVSHMRNVVEKAVNSGNETPFWTFCSVLTHLLERGADPLLENKVGVSAFGYVAERMTRSNSVSNVYHQRIQALLAPYV